MTTALLIIDVQNDFLPGGTLAVPDGDAVIAPINELIPMFPMVFASQDWHPAGHGSFASSHPGHSPGEVIQFRGVDQILWPDHCVQTSPGAALATDLDFPKGRTTVVRKGMDPLIDSYSAFRDNDRTSVTALDELLRERGVDALVVAGLATDYCVKWSVLDARDLGYDVDVCIDACRGVELRRGDVDASCDLMRAAGARLTTTRDVMHHDSIQDD